MATAEITGTAQSRVTFTSNVDANELVDTVFSSLPSASIVDTITQENPNTILIDWDSPVAGDTHIDSNGTTPGVLSPDTVNYS